MYSSLDLRFRSSFAKPVDRFVRKRHGVSNMVPLEEPREPLVELSIFPLRPCCSCRGPAGSVNCFSVSLCTSSTFSLSIETWRNMRSRWAFDERRRMRANPPAQTGPTRSENSSPDEPTCSNCAARSAPHPRVYDRPAGCDRNSPSVDSSSHRRRSKDSPPQSEHLKRRKHGLDY